VRWLLPEKMTESGFSASCSVPESVSHTHPFSLALCRWSPLFVRSGSDSDKSWAFPTEVLVYRRTAGAKALLKPCTGLNDWKAMAACRKVDALLAAVSYRPFLKCKQAAGTDALGGPLGISDR